MAAIHGVTHTAPAFEVPAGACDCHVHVFGPYDRFPLWPGRRYTPGPASVEDLLALQRALGLVARGRGAGEPAGHGQRVPDRRPAASARRRLAGARRCGDRPSDDGRRARGDARGGRARRARQPRVAGRAAIRRRRGASSGKRRRASRRSAGTSRRTRRCRCSCAVADAIGALPVPLVDRSLRRRSRGARDGPAGLRASCSTSCATGKVLGEALGGLPHLRRRRTGADAARSRRRSSQANPDRVVWGTDWPHPGGGDGPRSPDVVEPFFPIDDGRALNRLHEWIGDPAQLREDPRRQPGPALRLLTTLEEREQ